MCITEQPKRIDNSIKFGTGRQNYSGNSLPTWFGGWDNTFTVKDFDLNIFFRFSGGNKVANVTRRDMLDQGFVNSSKEILGRWQSETNPGDGSVPRLFYGRAVSLTLPVMVLRDGLRMVTS